MADELIFEEPWASTTGPKMHELWDDLVRLMEHDHRWVKLAHYDEQSKAHWTAKHFRSGHTAVPVGVWKFEARKRPDGSDLYGMFIMESPDGEPHVVSGRPGRPSTRVSHDPNFPV